MRLRDYQHELVCAARQSPGNVLIQLDTGAGKTPILSELASISRDVICVAHRNILVKQLSRELAKNDVMHDIIASRHTKRLCILEHRKAGKQMIDVCSSKYVCSIDSLLSLYKRGLIGIDRSKEWLVLVDEAHHMTNNNKWCRLIEIFPRCRVVGATATPCRLDGQSLSKRNGGVFDELIQASELTNNSVETLINRGYLSQFKCFSLPSHISESNLRMGITGDWTYKTLCNATRSVNYQMVGDAIKTYRRLANMKQALAFCVSIDLAEQTAQLFKRAGYSAASIHSKMSSTDVARVFDLFEARKIQVLCNVDMIGEGVDVPAIEALIMLRKTASFGLFRQWIGRSLRPEKNKAYAVLIDHVDNFRKHGLPDEHIKWNLENPPKLPKSNLISCQHCSFLNKAWETVCAECGGNIRNQATVNTASNAKYIDYDLVELHRRRADVERLRAEQEWQRNNVINEDIMNSKIDNGHLGQLLNQIRRVVVGNLLETISVKDCNRFIELTTGRDFWITNFSALDITEMPKQKPVNVYRKWLRSI